jgi:acyl carrier protein
MKQQIQTFVESLIAAPEAAIEEHTPLYSSGILSSMAHLKLVQFLERRFDVAIPMWEVSIDNFDTVDQIAGYVAGKMTATP